MKRFIPLLGFFVMCFVAVQFSSCVDPPDSDVKELTEVEKDNSEIVRITRQVVIDEVVYDVKWTESEVPVLIPRSVANVSPRAFNESKYGRRARDGFSAYNKQVKFYQNDNNPDEPTANADNEDVGWFTWIKSNGGKILAILAGLLGLVELIVQLTPTDRDNAWFLWLKQLLSGIIPNNKTGGGTHPVG